MPVCLLVRAGLNKPSSFRRTWPSIRSVSSRKSTTITLSTLVLKKTKIYLYMHDNHDVITKMPGFFARSYYCHTCKKVYDRYEEHLCPNECRCCGFSSICPEESWRTCQDCQQQFKSQRCYDQHKRSKGNARPVCQSLIRCMKCMEGRQAASGTRETSLSKAKVRDLRQVRATRRASLLYPTRNQEENRLLKKRKKCRKTGTTCRPSLIRNVDWATEY